MPKLSFAAMTPICSSKLREGSVDKTTIERDFFVKEIEYLRNGIDESIRETRSLERYSLLVTGAIWSWCAAAQGSPGLNVIVWLPSFLVGLFGIRAWGIAKEIKTIDKYLDRVEGILGLPEGLGWERRQAEQRSPFEVKSVYLFWAILQTATVVIALLYNRGIFTGKQG